MKRWMTALLALLLMASLTAGAAAEAVQTLPIYRAQERNQKQANFFDKVDVTWFNQSGEPALENWSKRARYDHYVFPDQAQLDIDVNVISYLEYDGTEMCIYADDPGNPEGPFPRKSFACAIGQMAGSSCFYAEYDASLPKPTLTQTELTGVTLESAKAQVEDLLQKLGAEGYELVDAIDMSAEKIHLFGRYEQKRRDETANKRTGEWDFSLATEADEGFYLFYSKTLNGLPVALTDGGGFDVRAFVNAQGVCLFKLVDSFAIGEVYETPDRLLTAEEARTAFERDNASREKELESVCLFMDAALKYGPRRAENKKDGVVFEPMWYIRYTRGDSDRKKGWAWYSAVDGKLIMDCYTK